MGSSMSTLKTGTVWADTHKSADGSLEFFKCRAWVNFNGKGTVAIRASGNVSSITDNGAGDYTVNFATAMPDANYAPTISTGPVNSGYPVHFTLSQTTAGFRLRTYGITNSPGVGDPDEIKLAIFR